MSLSGSSSCPSVVWTELSWVGQARRLSPDSRFAELVDGWLDDLGTTKPAANTASPHNRGWGLGRSTAIREAVALG